MLQCRVVELFHVEQFTALPIMTVGRSSMFDVED